MNYIYLEPFDDPCFDWSGKDLGHWRVFQPQNRGHSQVPGIYIYWVVPPPRNSHHQDYYIFSRGSRTKPSFATVTGRGDNPIYTLLGTNISFSQGMFEDDFPFPKVGYVSSLEGIHVNIYM